MNETLTLSPSVRGYDPEVRLELRSLLHTRNMFTTFPRNHTLSKVTRNLPEHRMVLLQDILMQKVGVSGRSLPGGNDLKKVLLQHLLPVLANLIDNHRRYNYKDALFSAFRKNKVDYPENSDESPIPIQVVFTYLCEAMKCVLPFHLIGRNSQGMEKLGRSLVRGCVPLSLQQLMNYITGSLMEGWIIHLPGNALRRHMAAKLSLWVAGNFISSVVRAGMFGTRIACMPVFFTKPAWQSRTKKALNNLLATGRLRKMPRDEPFNRILEPGFLRFVPKPSGGLRPIVSRKLHGEHFKSRVYKAKLLMKKINPCHLRFNEEWTKYRQTVLDARLAGEEGRVYFVRSDVRSAFVTVRQEKVLEVLAQHMAQLPAQVQVEQRVYTKPPPKPAPSSIGLPVSQGPSSSQSENGGPTSSQSDACETPVGSQSESKEQAPSQDETSSKETSTGQALPGPFKVRLVAVSRDSAHKTLRQEVEQQVVRHGSNNFFMKVGLAQGSPLSNNLSNLTLEHLCHTQLAPFSTEDGRSVLWRVADDFLLLTLCEDTARRFKEVLAAGFPDYGWEMSTEKSMDNLGRPELSTINFNGAMLDLVSLEAFADLSQHSADSVLHTMTFNQKTTSMNELFKKQLLGMGSLKIEPLFLNSKTLSRERLLQQISASGKLQALRLRALTRYLLTDKSEERGGRSRFLTHCIRKSCRRICERVRKVLGKGEDLPSDSEIKWLLYMAVYRRSSGYLGSARATIKRSLLELETLIPLDRVKQCYEAIDMVRPWDARDK